MIEEKLTLMMKPLMLPKNAEHSSRFAKIRNFKGNGLVIIVLETMRISAYIIYI